MFTVCTGDCSTSYLYTVIETLIPNLLGGGVRGRIYGGKLCLPPACWGGGGGWQGLRPLVKACMSSKCISTAMSACYPLRGSYQSHTLQQAVLCRDCYRRKRV